MVDHCGMSSQTMKKTIMIATHFLPREQFCIVVNGEASTDTVRTGTGNASKASRNFIVMWKLFRAFLFVW